MKIIIIDDEEMAIDVLRIMLNSLTQFEISIEGTFTNVVDALNLLDKESIDIVFLDIEMIDTHGLQVAKHLLVKHPSVQIIFVTAHAQFAVDAFELEATDYLLKPVHQKRLIKALTKAQQKWQLQKETAETENYMYAHTMGGFYLLDIQNEVVKWRTKKVRELFLYLWLHQQRPILNVVIIEVLWPNIEYEKASANLYTAIYQLRQLLKLKGIEKPIELVNNHYQLNVNIRSDYDELLRLLEKTVHSEHDIQQILNLYDGNFLEGEEYQWAIQMQNQIKQKILYVLERYATSDAWTNQLLKLNCLQKSLELDEYNERYMFLLLEFLIEQNKKLECIQLYTLIKEKLEGELNLNIPQRIQQIYDRYLMKRV